MKKLLLLPALLLALSAAAGEIWRYTDQDGVIQFTDDVDSIPQEYRAAAQKVRVDQLPTINQGVGKEQTMDIAGDWWRKARYYFSVFAATPYFFYLAGGLAGIVLILFARRTMNRQRKKDGLQRFLSHLGRK